MTVLLYLIGLATAFIAGLLVGRATARPDSGAPRSDGTGPTRHIREGRRRKRGKNKAPRVPRPSVRPKPRKTSPSEE